MIKFKQQRRRNRNKIDPANPPSTPLAHVVSVTASGASEVTIVFDSQVQMATGALPTTWHFGTSARTLTTATSTDGITWICGCSGTVAATQVYSMPGGDTAARTPLGGYVASSSGVLA